MRPLSWMWWAVAVLGATSAGATSMVDTCVVLDIDHVGFEAVQGLKSTSEASWWVEIGDRLLLCGSSGLKAQLAGERIVEVHPNVDVDRLRFGNGRVEELDADRVLARCGPVSVVESARSPDDPVQARMSKKASLMDFQPDVVLVRQEANAPPRPHRSFGRAVGDLVAEVDSARWYADIVTLASYDRYTFRSDINNAKDWLVTQFDALPGLEVTTPSFLVGGIPAYNIISTLVGQSRPHEWYIVGGHYDSITSTGEPPAPGAEDNASGCAGVLEMARIFTAHPPQSTILFICFAAEEQGLKGSQRHAQDLYGSGDWSKVKGMLNMDMIGYTSDSVLDCLLETDPWAWFLVDELSDAAAVYTTLDIFTYNVANGSDHVPYLDYGMPAVLSIENEYATYPHYHSTTDLPQYITQAMGRETLKMNVAVLAEWVDSGTSFIFGDGFETGGYARWSATVGGLP